jgi:hypothetical protein
MATCLHICQARSLLNESLKAETTYGTLWQPKQGTREEWMACRGMPKDVCERIKVKKQELKKALAKKYGLEDRLIASNSSTSDSGVNQCIMFTEDQLDMMIANAKQEEISAHRKKRTLIDFTNNPSSKWSMPIPFMFDGTHNDTQKATIRAAFQHWADNTCVRFEELPTNAPFNSNYILIQTKIDECSSYVGRIEDIPQLMNLASGCLEPFGTVLHEIGHALGLDHEQSRLGRDESVKILWENIQPDAWSEYEESTITDALGLPYNYGSVMHYSSKDGFGVSPELDTMLALQTLYQMNMGQSVDLSFHDRKIINLGYCEGVCTTPLAQPCQRSGYQNPNNCSTCICPDGFSGQFCNDIAQPQNADCGGILNIEPGTLHVIESPGYNTTGYSQHQECIWWIKAPASYTLELEFSEDFGIICSVGSACKFHWVEIKYKNDLGLEGPRFCCYDRPSDILISESNEMMVIFQSNYSFDPEDKSEQGGFQAIVKSINSSSSSTSTPATTTPISSSTASVSSRSSLTTNPAAGASMFLLLSLLLQLRYLSHC